METIQKRINDSGREGSDERVYFISNLSPNLYPENSINAAKRCIYKRARRLDLKQHSLTSEQINNIVESELLLMNINNI